MVKQENKALEPIDPQKVLKSQTTMAMITHLHDILDAMNDSIFGRLGAMPYMLRFFFKILY
jgi:hypothetical protein